MNRKYSRLAALALAILLAGCAGAETIPNSAAPIAPETPVVSERLETPGVEVIPDAPSPPPEPDADAATPDETPSPTPPEASAPPSPAAPVAAAKITLNAPTPAELTVGERVSVGYAVSPADAADKTVTFSSSDASVASVSGATVTAVGLGGATITARTANGVTASFRVTVLTLPESLTLGAPGTLSRYASARLTASGYPVGSATGALNFTSDDESVLSCTASGELYAKKAGSATITCVSSYGVSASARVTVIVPVERVAVAVNGTRFKLGATAAFTVSVYPEDATYASISITTDGCLVTDGVLEFTAAGMVTVTATADNGVSGSAQVAVIDAEAYISEVIRLVNVERAAAGLSALETSAPLHDAANVRAVEIRTLFDHTRPDGSSGFTALDEFSVPYSSAAENIAAGQRSPAYVVEAWMNSAGHRANILNGSFGKIGVGFDLNGTTLYWTQFFTD
ncbi:MAG: CAP domain-containing protein [Oscillospiraceae bacterium]|jgi:uncharacterized protein YkwD|nr:CAP domain-containing protein [Oscillospiraceae bacterium]